MKISMKFLSVALLTICSLALVACNNAGTPPPPATFKIGGTVINLAGMGGGLVLQNNSQTLPVNANGSFTFPTTVASGGSYSVTISAQPSNPAQTCGVVNGSGVATADVTGLQINCAHNEWTWVKGPTPSATVGSTELKVSPPRAITPADGSFPSLGRRRPETADCSADTASIPPERFCP